MLLLLGKLYQYIISGRQEAAQLFKKHHHEGGSLGKQHMGHVSTTPSDVIARNTRRSPNVRLMLAHRRRRWVNSNLTLAG